MTNLYHAPADIVIQPNVIIGLTSRPNAKPARFGAQCVLRAGSIIYAEVTTGNDFQTGHNVMIREKTVIGDHVVIGTNTVIDGQVTIGDFVKIESNCYIPTHTSIGTRVFFGPGVTLLNDQYPLKMRDLYQPVGPVIEEGVTLGGGVTVLPGVTVGRGSFVAAGTVVNRDIPPMSLVKGVPGKASPLTEKLHELNMALSWRKYLANG